MGVNRYLGGVVSADPNTPTVTSASGTWTLEEAYQNIGNWPMAQSQIQNSLRFNSADSAYLSRTPATAGNRRTFTLSFWIKSGSLAAGTTGQIMGTTVGTYDRINFGENSTAQLSFTVDAAGTSKSCLTPGVYRDPSAWYHFVVAVDTTQATDTNRVKIYANGVQQTLTGTFPTQNYQSSINNNVAQYIGSDRGSTYFLAGYLTEINFIDGLALSADYFGFTDANGIWQPKPYKGAYGTNGFYLTFSDNSGTTSTTLGKDYSGNGNNWTPNNFSVTAGAGNDSLVDTPTPYGTDTGVGGEVRGNYATLNAVDKNSQIALANGNLDYTNSSSNANTQARATIAYPLTGKWYFESTRGGGGSSFAAGIGTSTTSLGTQNAGIIMYNEAGQIYVGGVLNSTPGTTFASGDTMGVAVDMDAAKVYWYKNGVVINASGLSFTVGSSTWMPMIGCYTNGDTGTLNFGQRAFAYTAPSGFKALCTQNLPEPTVKDGGNYFDVSLWTGNQSARTITNSNGFQPDFIWTKSRSDAESHRLSDSVRGGNGTVLYTLLSNTTDQEGTDTDVTGFVSNGFTIRAGSNSPNVTGRTYVGWQWKAGGTGVTNTAGTITSTVSVNTTSGFSIVTYTGNGSANATVGHGLGVSPSMVIVKKRTGGSQSGWVVHHSSFANSASDYLSLQTTDGIATASNWFSKSSTTFGFPTVYDGTNTNTSTYVAYCFAPVAGYSAFGKYTGNGSSDGPFIYTGFRPRYYILKNITSGQSWSVQDTARSSYNVGSAVLLPNSSNAEATGTDYVDILSNGFKIRHTSAAGNNNNSGDTYIYAAFAENPFKLSRAR